MKYRTFGNAGLEVSIFGLEDHHLAARNDGNDFHMSHVGLCMVKAMIDLQNL